MTVVVAAVAFITLLVLLVTVQTLRVYALKRQVLRYFLQAQPTDAWFSHVSYVRDADRPMAIVDPVTFHDYMAVRGDVECETRLVYSDKPREICVYRRIG